ncbi:hypothetical protein AAFN46_02940 [Pseudomonas sp. CAU 1711]|uniref:hypothetical protein n=1 Tax=Pseudomonas sp. CAU 1711 TaxID=3140356 RepID=UPI003260ACB8
MNLPTPFEQHQALRQRLQQQRQRIEHLLARSQYDDGVFPRSLTMRLLTRRPALVVRLAMQLALLLSPGLLRSLSAALLTSRLLHVLAASRQPPHERG